MQLYEEINKMLKIYENEQLNVYDQEVFDTTILKFEQGIGC